MNRLSGLLAGNINLPAAQSKLFSVMKNKDRLNLLNEAETSRRTGLAWQQLPRPATARSQELLKRINAASIPPLFS